MRLERSICFSINNVAFGHGVGDRDAAALVVVVLPVRVPALLGRNRLWCGFPDPRDMFALFVQIRSLVLIASIFGDERGAVLLRPSRRGVMLWI